MPASNYCDAETRVNFGALLVSLLKCGEYEAADALWDWAEDWLDLDRDELEEELGIQDA